MPIYEYSCEKCEKIHEAWQKITEDALTDCPECGGPIERIISQTSFALKGSGWNATDYKGGAPADSPKPEAGKESGKEPGKESGKESGSGDGGGGGSETSTGSADSAKESTSKGSSHNSPGDD